jgi:hypothetical protein
MKYAAHVQDDESDKHPFRVSDRLFCRVRSDIANAHQFRIVQKFFPDFTVICRNRQKIQKDNLTKADREKLKQASKALLATLQEKLKTMPNWTKNETTRADVQICILDNLYNTLPRPPFTEQDAEALATRIYGYVWQRSNAGMSFALAA